MEGRGWVLKKAGSSERKRSKRAVESCSLGGRKCAAGARRSRSRAVGVKTRGQRRAKKCVSLALTIQRSLGDGEVHLLHSRPPLLKAFTRVVSRLLLLVFPSSLGPLIRRGRNDRLDSDSADILEHTSPHASEGLFALLGVKGSAKGGEEERVGRGDGGAHGRAERVSRECAGEGAEHLRSVRDKRSADTVRREEVSHSDGLKK